MSRAPFPCSSGVEPNLYAWNTLIGVFGSVEDVDGAYQVWLKMLQSGVTPDMHTQVPCCPLACASSTAAVMHHMTTGVLDRAKPPMCLGRCKTLLHAVIESWSMCSVPWRRHSLQLRGWVPSLSGRHLRCSHQRYDRRRSPSYDASCSLQYQARLADSSQHARHMEMFTQLSRVVRDCRLPALVDRVGVGAVPYGGTAGSC